MDEKATDAQLLSDYARTGNHEAFGVLVRRYVDLVNSTACRIARDGDRAQDITQATFIVLAKKAGRVDPRLLAGWLVNTARLAGREAMRDERVRQKHEIRAMHMRQSSEPLGEGSGVADILPLLDDALGALHAADRTVLARRYFQDETFAEAGRAMGITEEAARKRVARALERLRKILVKRGVTATGASLMIVLASQKALAAPASVVSAAVSAGAGGISAATVLASRVLAAMRLAILAIAGVVSIGVVVAGVCGIWVGAVLRPAVPAVVAGGGGGAAGGTVAATSAALATAPLAVRVRYVAGAGVGGADWSRLAPMADVEGASMAIAHVTAGGRFPVQDPGGTTLFNVRMVSGDDERVVLEVLEGGRRNRVEVPRGEQAVNVEVAGEEFALVYGTWSVAATPETLETPPTTDKVGLVVVRTGTSRPPGVSARP